MFRKVVVGSTLVIVSTRAPTIDRPRENVGGNYKDI